MTLMRNLSILILVVLATLGFWGLCTTAYLMVPTGPFETRTGVRGEELLNAAVLCGWLFFVGSLGRKLFAGTTARRFLIVTVALVVLLCLWFSWSLHISLEPAQLLEKGPE